MDAHLTRNHPRLETPDTTPEIDAAVLAVLNGAADAIRKIARGAK